jgi:hypothetical protein
MTTQHEEESRRSGGFRDAVNELFGRGERGDGRDTSQLDALDREEAQRHGEDAGYAGDPAAGGARHDGGGQAAQEGQYGEARLDDPAQQTTPGVRHDAGDPAAAGVHPDETGRATGGAHGDPFADDVAGRPTAPVGRHDEAVAGDRPVDATDPAGQHTPPEGRPLAQSQHLGDASTPHGGEVRGDNVAPEHVRQGGDPTAHGQVQHGGELRGDPGLASADTRSDADLTTGSPDRSAAVDAGTGRPDRAAAADAGRASGGTAAGAGAAAVSADAAHHDVASSANGDDGDRAALVTRDRAESYGARWDAVKGEFVDEPRRAVADADALVGELLDELQELFKQQRTQIEQGLDADETSTEDLRVALRRYRSFFDRLLSI